MSGLGKCAPCLDKAITGPSPGQMVPLGVPDAVVLVTVIQQFSGAVPGQQVAAPCLMAVCLDCRKAQLGTVSKKGLLLA